MSRIVWDKLDERIYETGIDRGVFYRLNYPGNVGVAWNGLTSVTKNAKGGDQEEVVFDGRKVRDSFSPELFQATVEAITYPEELEEAEGYIKTSGGVTLTHQTRRSFNMCYRTLIGDSEDLSAGYKIHLVWNAVVSPNAKAYRSMTNLASPSVFQWTMDATPPASRYFRPTPYLVIDSRDVNENVLAAFEEILYGSNSKAPFMPLQSTVVELFGMDIPEPEDDFIDGGYYNDSGMGVLDGGSPDDDSEDVVDGGDPSDIYEPDEETTPSSGGSGGTSNPPPSGGDDEDEEEPPIFS